MEAPEQQTDKLKVLFVDDHRHVSVMFTKILEMAGYDVTPVNDGKSAMTELESNQYDIMITNLMMPHIDGLGLIDWTFRNILPRPFIVFHPCRLFKENEKPPIIELGANLVLCKMTYDPSDFGDIIRSHYKENKLYKDNIIKSFDDF